MLWIRTQNKEELIKPDNICYVEFEGNHCIGLGIGYIFGYYKSKERALEVLDKIEELINYKLHGEEKGKYVYQMPKD